MSLLTLNKKLSSIGKRVYFEPKDYERLAKAFGVSPEEVAKLAPQMPGGTSPSLELDEVRKDSTGSGRIYTFIASDGSVDRSGDTINPDGWDLTGWKKTGSPILFGHDGSSLPIGKGVAARVDKGRLMVSVRFAPTSMAQRVEQLVAGDHGLQSVSVGFVPKTWSMSTDRDRLHGIDYKTQRLLELSVVSVPANENAVLQRELTPEERKAARQSEVTELRAKGEHYQRQAEADKAAVRAAHEKRKLELIAEAEQARRAKLSPEQRHRELYATLRGIAGKALSIRTRATGHPFSEEHT